MRATPNQNQDVKLQELLLRFFENFTYEVCVSSPAKIISYNKITGLASVQVTVLKNKKDGTSYKIPTLTNVPVLFPQGSFGFIKWPLQKNDPVLLIFADRSIDNWINGSGEPVDPKDRRSHNLNDAIAIPGLLPSSKNKIQLFPNSLEVNSQKIAIGNGKTGTAGTAGVIPIEIVNILSTLVNLLSGLSTVGTGADTINPTFLTDMSALKLLIDQLKPS